MDGNKGGDRGREGQRERWREKREGTEGKVREGGVQGERGRDRV